MGNDIDHRAQNAAPLETQVLQERCGEDAMQTARSKANSLMAGEWYVLHTRARHEKAIAARLKDASTEVFLPLHRRRKKWRNGVHAEVDFPLLPCYLFVRAHTANCTRLLETKGVLGFAGAVTMPAEEIARLRAATELGAVPHPGIEKGDPVQVVSGPLRGAVGVLERTDQGCRVVLSYAQMHRTIAVALDEEVVEAL